MKSISTLGLPNSLLGATLLLALTQNGWAFSSGSKKCEIQFDPSAVKVEWTAYKTTAKVPVSGTFKEVKIQGASQGADVKSILSGASVEITGNTIDSGNAGRDQNIREAFLSHLAKQASFGGKFSDVKESSFTLQMDFNGMTRAVPMTYALKEGQFVATGGFDLLDFKATQAFDGIHERCKELHKGADGVSKTWSEIALKVSAPYSETCRN